MPMPSPFRSYADQARHYFFERPHESVRLEPLESPAAWRGASLDEGDWRVELTPAQIDDARKAVLRASAVGRPLEELSAEAFPLPHWSDAMAAWRSELTKGKGFLLVSGLPVEDWTDEEAGIFFWGFGLHMGWPGAQNPEGDLLGHVVDTGEDDSDPFVRRYKTAGDIAFHCDAADGVGLFCLRTARHGGASRIASSVTVYNEILARRPEWVSRLYESFQLDLRNENGDGQGWIPVTPCRHAHGQLRTFYHSDYFRSAPRHADVPALSETDLGLLDLYETIAHEPEIRLDMELKEGDIQLLSNHTIVHARTAYEDTEGSSGGRHLLRLWLSLQAEAK